MEPASFSLLLKAKGLKAADLARALDVDKATISRWQHGVIPAERVPEVERSTGISRHDLRPDLWPRGEAAA
jgi:DNA-binding transcriptional regulator YdaS (Cro superfamily)